MELQLIQNKIHQVRSKRVILDYDLAKLYEVEARVLIQSVKRNLKRFPQDFMFQISRDEWADIMNSSQFVMSSRKHRGLKPAVRIHRARSCHVIKRFKKRKSN